MQHDTNVNISAEKVSPKPQTTQILIGMIVIGLITFVIGLLTNSSKAWHSFLLNQMYFLGFTVGGMFILAVHYLAGAGWIAVLRRIPEAFTSYLPVAFVMSLILLGGLGVLYPWTDHEMMHADHFLHHKTGYFSTAFFVARVVLFFGIMMFFAWRFVSNSTRQDSEGGTDLTAKQKPLSALWLVLFAPMFTIVAVDLLKSLDPKWFSTMWGVYVFAGYVQATFAAIILSVIQLKKHNYLAAVRIDHFHDLGKYMFGFTVFWAYIGVSQYLLIWYANLPEETTFYIAREQGSWAYMSILLIAIRFIIPFLLLLPRAAKRNPNWLRMVAIIILVGEWIDLNWIVMPAFSPAGVSINWVDIGLFIGFAGLFILMARRFLVNNSTVPVNDPYLHESVNHHVHVA